MLTKEDVELLSKEFPESTLGIKVQSTSKDKTKAMLICYLQHNDVMGRLDQVDPAWTNQRVSMNSEKTDFGMIYICEMTLTLKGVTRINVGEGNTEKAAYSNALKRCAMMFGVGRYLYDSEQVWVPYNESMKFKQWTYDEYKAALKQPQDAETHRRSPQAGSTGGTQQSQDPGKFMFQYGPLKGKTAEQIQPDVLSAQLQKDQAWYQSQGKPYPAYLLNVFNWNLPRLEQFMKQPKQQQLGNMHVPPWEQDVPLPGAQ